MGVDDPDQLSKIEGHNNRIDKVLIFLALRSQNETVFRNKGGWIYWREFPERLIGTVMCCKQFETLDSLEEYVYDLP